AFCTRDKNHRALLYSCTSCRSPTRGNTGTWLSSWRANIWLLYVLVLVLSRIDVLGHMLWWRFMLLHRWQMSFRVLVFNWLTAVINGLNRLWGLLAINRLFDRISRGLLGWLLLNFSSQPLPVRCCSIPHIIVVFTIGIHISVAVEIWYLFSLVVWSR